jgi:hypothetical protein
VTNPCLITRDNGGQEIVILSDVTTKQLQADDFYFVPYSLRLGFEGPIGYTALNILTGEWFLSTLLYQYQVQRRVPWL